MSRKRFVQAGLCGEGRTTQARAGTEDRPQKSVDVQWAAQLNDLSHQESRNISCCGLMTHRTPDMGSGVKKQLVMPSACGGLIAAGSPCSGHVTRFRSPAEAAGDGTRLGVARIFQTVRLNTSSLKTLRHSFGMCVLRPLRAGPCSLPWCAAVSEITLVGTWGAGRRR